MESVSGYYYKLTGLICCGECGAPMSGLRRKTGEVNTTTIIDAVGHTRKETATQSP